MSTITHLTREYAAARFMRITSAISCAFTVLSVCAQSPASPAVATPLTAAAYKTAADIPVGEFFRLPSYSQMAMSPDGKKLAALAPVNGRENLVVIDLETRKSNATTAFSTVDVNWFTWVDNGRLIFRASNRQLETGVRRRGAMIAIDVDGQNSRNLAYDIRGGFDILARTRDGSGELIVSTNLRDIDSDDLYRFDTRTGRSKLLTFDSPGRVVDWVIDQTLEPRVALRLEPRESASKPRRRTLWHRKSANESWQQIGESTGDLERMMPLAFDDDNQTLFVSARNQEDRSAIYRYDIANKRLGEVIAKHPWIDLNGGLLSHPGNGKVLGLRHSAEMPSTSWFDPRYAAIQVGLDKALPNTVNRITPGDDASRFLIVFAQSATEAGTYFVFDTQKRTLDRVAGTRDWLPSTLMPERRFVTYKARDGLNIPAWLTVPRSVEAKNLPLIVNIHGGPWVRGYQGVQWGRWPEAQFFASRGYAVLEPEPRGSVGFGAKHYQSSFKQWGLSMQDDITDGALHLANEGIVDKSRMCLFGGSYGGYATLQGLVRDPNLWKCGHAYVAVTDIELKQNVTWSDTARYSDYYETDFKRWIGDAATDRARFDATSPAKNAAKIKAAVMLTMGGQDQRVPLIHGTAMRDAMEKVGKPLDYTVYLDEGHGFNAHHNVVDFYTRTEAFFAKHLK
jgi:dipeptidyl aminopeptidase/acylaminoacyl peptidase